MSGHSKWSQIKRTKGANDAKRGAIFAKHSKKISLAVREGGSGDPDHNFKLRIAIDKAKQLSMPNDNIERAIKKGLGQDSGATLESVVYEGYGPAGIALIIESVTDNKNRTVSNVKHLLSKFGGSLGAQGSVAWQFQTRGQIMVDNSNNIEKAQLAAIDAGAIDALESDEGLIIYTNPEELELIKAKLEQVGIVVSQAEIMQTSSQPIGLSAEEHDKADQLLAALEDDEDITAIHTNIE